MASAARRTTPTFDVLQVAYVIERVLQRLEARPRWLRWLEAAPLSFREADRIARRAYLFYQLPCVAVFGEAFDRAGKVNQLETDT